MQQVKKDPSIIITKAGKGNITTVLDKEWYDHSINKIMCNQETCKHFKANATAFNNQDVNKFVNNLLEITKIPKTKL